MFPAWFKQKFSFVDSIKNSTENNKSILQKAIVINTCRHIEVLPELSIVSNYLTAIQAKDPRRIFLDFLFASGRWTTSIIPAIIE